MLHELRIACNVCESGAIVEKFKHIVFAEGTLRAFNGVVWVQAPSSIDPAETFAVSEERLMQALSACEGDGFATTKVSLNKDFLILKKDKLTVRVRKIDASGFYNEAIVAPSKKDRIKCPLVLQEALRAVAPFMSADASRPWTTSILLRDGYAWATNNLSLVKFPLDLPVKEWRIPAAAVPILLSLPDVEWIAMEGHRIVVGWGQVRIAFPAASAEWPADLSGFFKKAPKKLPTLASELRDAAKIVDKFADRFVSLRPEKVEGKLATIESDYEIEVPNGKGSYPAKLLLLILNHASHADFSTYPEPIFFAGEKLRGVAVGAKE